MKSHIIKLGGSVLTGKGEIPSVDLKNTKSIIQELSSYYHKCIFIHGTGNYGKPPALKYGYYKSGIIKKKNRQIALEIKQSLQQLNLQVLNLFISAGIPATAINIDQIYDSKRQLIDVRKLNDALKVLELQRLFPVFYGDLVELPNGNFKVISSDEIVLELSKIIQPRSVIFLSNVDGVYLKNEESENGAPYKITNELNLKNIQCLYIDPNDKKDVSGGMNKKAKTSLQISMYCKSCLIGNGYTPGILSDFLADKKVRGTYVTT